MKNILSILMVITIIISMNHSLLAQQKKKVAPRTTTTTPPKSNLNSGSSSQSQPVQNRTYQEPVRSTTSSSQTSSNNDNSSNSYASDEPTQVIKLNPLGFLIGYYSIEYEKATGDHSSFIIGGGYWNGFGTSTAGLAAANGGLNFYLSKDRNAPRGVYVGPRVGAVFSTAKGSGSSSGFLYTAGASFGYQIVGKSGFAADFGVGANYVNFKDNQAGSGGIIPSFQIAIGYGF
jgi:hypothetical protein